MMRATRATGPKRIGRIQHQLRYFHNEPQDRAHQSSASAGFPLAMRLLTNAMTFEPVYSRPRVTRDSGDPASFSETSVFDTQGEPIDDYDASGRVQSGPPVAHAASAAPEQGQQPVPESAQGGSGVAAVPREQVVPVARRDSSHTESELQRIDAADDDQDFLKRLKAITSGPELVQSEKPAPTVPEKPTVAQSRHAIFDELSPLLHRAQTYDLGTHRIDRRRLDALAASVLADEERKASLEVIDDVTTKEAVTSVSDADPTLDLDVDELKAALAGVAPSATADEAPGNQELWPEPSEEEAP